MIVSHNRYHFGKFDASYYDDGPYDYRHMPEEALCYGEKEIRESGFTLYGSNLRNGQPFYTEVPVYEVDKSKARKVAYDQWGQEIRKPSSVSEMAAEIFKSVRVPRSEVVAIMKTVDKSNRVRTLQRRRQRRRVRSVETSKRDPGMDAMGHVIDILEGRHNDTRKLPALDVGQVGKVLIADAIKEPCYLCGEKSDIVARFDVPQGLNLRGQRLILYGLCYGCKIEPSSKGIAEGKLILALQFENKGN